MTDASRNPYAPPRTPEPEPEPEPEPVVDPLPETRGIGGWLVFSLIGVIAVGAVTGIGVSRIVLTIGDWIAAFAQSGTPGLILGRVLLIWSMFVMSAMAIWWMFRHDRRLPKLMMVYYGIQFIISAIWVTLYDGSSHTGPSSDAYESGRLIGKLIWIGRSPAWILYYWRSERVKNTFTK